MNDSTNGQFLCPQAPDGIYVGRNKGVLLFVTVDPRVNALALGRRTSHVRLMHEQFPLLFTCSVPMLPLNEHQACAAAK